MVETPADVVVLLETACEDVFLGTRLAELLTLLLDVNGNLVEVLEELPRTVLIPDVLNDDTAAVVLAFDNFVDDLTTEVTKMVLEDDSLDDERDETFIEPLTVF